MRHIYFTPYITEQSSNDRLGHFLRIDNISIILVYNSTHYLHVCDGEHKITAFPESIIECTVHFDHFLIFTESRRIYKSYNGKNWELADLYSGEYHRECLNTLGFYDGSYLLDVEKFIDDPKLSIMKNNVNFMSMHGKVYGCVDGNDYGLLREYDRNPPARTVGLVNTWGQSRLFTYKDILYLQTDSGIKRCINGEWEDFPIQFLETDGTTSDIKITSIFFITSSNDSKYIYLFGYNKNIYIGDETGKFQNSLIEYPELLGRSADHIISGNYLYSKIPSTKFISCHKLFPLPK